VEYLDSHSDRWPDDGGPAPWQLTFHWAVVDGRPECVGLDIRSFQEERSEKERKVKRLPGTDPEPIRATTLRKLDLGRLLDEAREDHKALMQWAATYGKGVEAALRKRALEVLPVFEEGGDRSRGGRPPLHGPDHFEKVARTYIEALTHGRPPLKAVAAWGSVSASTAAKWVARCRELGLLGPTTQGKAGGMPRPSTGRRKR
jgi:hypothetical protein